jgi:AcrR family transcriptional regulator
MYAEPVGAGRIGRMPADRRRRLVEVAAAEFASAGFESASLNHIISQCGMSKSSFYYLFASKSELFDFVVRELMDSGVAEIAIPAPEEFAGHDFWRRIEEFFSQLVRASQQHEAFLTLGRMFYSDTPDTAKSAVNDAWAGVRAWVEGVLRVGRQSGAVRDDLPEALQCRLTFQILQVFDEWTVAHFEGLAPADLHALADAQFGTVRRLLEA